MKFEHVNGSLSSGIKSVRPDICWHKQNIGLNMIKYTTKEPIKKKERTSLFNNKLWENNHC